MLNIDEVKDLMNICLEKIHENEFMIIRNNINERTIAHKLAEYMQVEFCNIIGPDYNVDVEYNRNYEKGEYYPKILPMLKDEVRKYRQNVLGDSGDVESLEKIINVSTYPDIIVHKRFINDDNILVVEIKKSNNPIGSQFDDLKLKGFTSKTDGYGYLFGLHITFYVQDDWKQPLLVWYRDGAKITP